MFIVLVKAILDAGKESRWKKSPGVFIVLVKVILDEERRADGKTSRHVYSFG